MKYAPILFAAGLTVLISQSVLRAQTNTFPWPPSGNIGIGTTEPSEKLQIGTALTFHDGEHDVIGFGWSPAAHQALQSGHPADIRWDGSSLSFGIDATQRAPGERVGGVEALRIESNANILMPHGNIGIGTTSPGAKLDIAGTTRTGVLQITGGRDMAEPFEFSKNESIQPGMIVAIDPERPGRLRIAHKAYDRTVAGIVSGANGITPGLMMGHQGTVANGSLPVSLIGRVYGWVDASYGPIEPGDLLTTSDTPGHAMKVADYVKAQGAIIGKAMTPLKEGKALVLVLVSLQ
jgi:hypothetical protein